MSELQKRKVGQGVGADATTPEDRTKQRRICETKALTYITVDEKNLHQMRTKVREQLHISSDENEEDLDMSAKDWWLKADEFIHGEDMLRTGFFILVQDNESKKLIGFNLYTHVLGKKECADLFVQRDYRRRGIASEMLKQSGIRYALALKEAKPFWHIWAERNNCTFPPGSSFMRPVAD